MSPSIDVTRCKCWKVPFEPPSGCYDYCTGQILRLAKPYELEEYFNIKPALAEKIFELTSNERLNNLSDFKEFLGDDEYNEINIQLSNMNQKGIAWIRRTFKKSVESEDNVRVHA